MSNLNKIKDYLGSILDDMDRGLLLGFLALTLVAAIFGSMSALDIGISAIFYILCRVIQERYF